MASELVTAALLGIVEGLTEFLPISSTGHLILVGKLLEFEGPKAQTFEVFIQLGAILAVVVLYWKRFLGLLSAKREPGLVGINGIIKLAIACFPLALLGLLFHKKIKLYLFAPKPVAAALILGGIVMLLVERKRVEPRVQHLDELSYADALKTGLFQCFAMWPGVSRSGSMIVGGMLCGLSRSIAAEFSFLVAVPMMVMATGYDLWKSREFLSSADVPVFAVGFIVSFLSALLAIRFFIALLRAGTLTPYAIYRILLGVAVLLLL